VDEVIQLNQAESALLLACARTHLDSDAHARISRLLEGPVRWTRLVDAANGHGVLPLLHAALTRVGSRSVPPRAMQRIRAEARANVHHSLFLMSELRRLLDVFEREGITAIPFKGPVLGAMAYRDVTLRQFTDLDLFVRRRELATLVTLMLANGYLSNAHDGAEATRRSIASDGDVAYRGPSYYAFYRADGRCRVDLQWRMAGRFFSFTLDDLAQWELADVPFAGRGMRTFSVTDTLLILCVHGSKHQWEHLKWICDVAECIRARGDEIDWTGLRDKARLRRAGRMVCLGLALAESLLGAPVPRHVSAWVWSDPRLSVLVRDCGAALFHDAAQAAGLPRLLFYMKTQDGWRERTRFGVTYARQWVARVVKPNDRDTAWVALPRRLEPLYYLLRPARVLASFARRASAPGRSGPSPPATFPTPPRPADEPRPGKEPANADT